MLTQSKAPRRRSRRSTFNAVIPASTTCKSRFSIAASVTRMCIPSATNGTAPLIPACPAMKSSDASRKPARTSRSLRKATSPASVAWWIPAAFVKAARKTSNNSATKAQSLPSTDRINTAAALALQLRPVGAADQTVNLRSRVEAFKGSDEWRAVSLQRSVPVEKTAVLICDMWDKHWCRGATERVNGLVAKMAPFLESARKRGIQIIHAPSETMAFYQDAPQRKRIL